MIRQDDGSTSTGGSAMRAGRVSRAAAEDRRRIRARRGSSSSATLRRACTSTCGWRSTVCSCPGRCPRGLPPTPGTSGSRPGPRTTRSTTWTSRAGSPRVSTAPAPWSSGTPAPTAPLGEHEPAEGLERGHLTVWFEGEKLTGGYAFTHAKLRGDEDGWLLVKVDDEGADRRRNPTRTQPESALSGKRNEDLW